jgi:hypothetical protein
MERRHMSDVKEFTRKQWKGCCGKGCKSCEIAQTYIGAYGKKKGLKRLAHDRDAALKAQSHDHSSALKAKDGKKHKTSGKAAKH